MSSAARILAIFLIPLAGVTGCGESRSGNAAASSESDDLRVVSLTPGITKMLADMGLGDRLVGVAENDDAVPPGIDPPVMGNFVDVDMEKLAVARPSHVLMMTAKEGPPANLRAMAERVGFTLVAYPYPKSVPDVLAMLHDTEDRLDPPSVGEALGRPERARALRQTLEEGLARIATLTGNVERPRTLLVIGEGVPVMALGPGGPIHDLLRIAGGANAAAASGVPAPTYDREKLAALDPEVIIVLSPGGPPLGDMTSDARLTAFRGLPVPAVERDRVYLINDPLVLLPSTSMLEVAAKLVSRLHPELAPAVERVPREVRSEP